MTIYILPWCRGPAFLYGSTLTLKTLRTGFPTAEVRVIDNSPVTLPEIRELALSIGATYSKLTKVIEHWEFIEAVVMAQHSGPVVIVDPDVAFWENCEDFHFDALVAGRYIPTFNCEFSKTLTMERLHTSFLWIQDPEKLRAVVSRLFSPREVASAFTPVVIPGSPWVRYDTAALLYAAIKESCHTMTDEELSRFDHLFCGSNIDVVGPHLRDDGMLAEIHKGVVLDHTSLRGAWSRQRKHFESRAQ